MGIFSGRDNRTPTERIENVVGPSTTLKGSIQSDGGVRIDGAFEGTIQVGGNVVIGENGQVKGDISAKNVTVGGQVVGNIEGQGRLEILSSGQVLGDICVATVMIDEGGVFQGISRIRGFEQRALAAPADAAPASRNTVVEVVAKGKPTNGQARPQSQQVVDSVSRVRPEVRRDEPVTTTARPTTNYQAPASQPSKAPAQPIKVTPQAAPAHAAAVKGNKKPGPADMDLDSIEPVILEGSTG